MNKELHFSSARTGSNKQDRWETPPAIFNKLNDEFGFTLDATADSENALCDYYFTDDDNALAQDWSNQTVYCNPPYSKLKAFAQKAKQEVENGATVVMLVPARTDTIAFHEGFSDSEVRFIKSRIKYLQDGKEGHPAPFPSMICVMGKEIKPVMGTTTLDSLKLK